MLDFWRQALSLTDWQITWELTDKLEGLAAGGGKPGGRVLSSGPYTRAHLMFVRSHIDECVLPSELEITVLHELFHCIFAPLCESTRAQIGGSSLSYDAIHWEIEALCDRLAAIIYHAVRQVPQTVGYSPLPKGR